MLQVDTEAGPPVTSTEEDSAVEPGRSHRPVVRYGVDEYCDAATVCHIAYHATQIEEPASIEEALSSECSTEWKAAADA